MHQEKYYQLYCFHQQLDSVEKALLNEVDSYDIYKLKLIKNVIEVFLQFPTLWSLLLNHDELSIPQNPLFDKGNAISVLEIAWDDFENIKNSKEYLEAIDDAKNKIKELEQEKNINFLTKKIKQALLSDFSKNGFKMHSFLEKHIKQHLSENIFPYISNMDKLLEKNLDIETFSSLLETSQRSYTTISHVENIVNQKFNELLLFKHTMPYREELYYELISFELSGAFSMIDGYGRENLQFIENLKDFVGSKIIKAINYIALDTALLNHSTTSPKRKL